MKPWTPNPVEAAQLRAWADNRPTNITIFTELYDELVQNRPVPADPVAPVSPPKGTGRTFAHALALVVAR